MEFAIAALQGLITPTEREPRRSFLLGRGAMPRERHTPYYTLLESFEEKGCPICHLLVKSLERYLRGLLYDNVNDPKTREVLRKSKGFCNTHAWRLKSIGDGLGTAIIYKDILNNLHAQMRAVPAKELSQSIERTAKGRILSSLKRTTSSCPACLALKGSEKRYLEALTENIDDGQLSSAYKSSDGFCLPHFLRVVKMVKSKEHRAFLIQVQAKKIEILSGELSEFIRKHDYRFSREGYGKEADSWVRAIEMVVGRRGIS